MNRILLPCTKYDLKPLTQKAIWQQNFVMLNIYNPLKKLSVLGKFDFNIFVSSFPVSDTISRTQTDANCGKIALTRVCEALKVWNVFSCFRWAKRD